MVTGAAGAYDALAAAITAETNGSWTRKASTFTVGADGPSINKPCLTLVIGNNGSSDLYLTGLQIEPGPAATPFEHRPVGVELSLCRRYYARLTMQVESGGKTDVWHHGMRTTPAANALSGGSTPYPKSPDYTVMGSSPSTQDATVAFDAEL